MMPWPKGRSLTKEHIEKVRQGMLKHYAKKRAEEDESETEGKPQTARDKDETS